MKTTYLRPAMVLAMVGLGGCSGSDVSEVSELPTGETLAAASLNPTPTLESTEAITSSTAVGPDGATNKVEPFRNPFAPPKDAPPPPIVEQPDPEPEPTVAEEPPPEIRAPGTPPKIRLLGFMNIGEPKVLVSHRNEVEALAIGDTLEDMKVVKIDSPDLTMLFDEREIKLSLFDQAWQHEGGPASAGNNSRVQTRPRSTWPVRNTGTSASGGVTAREPTHEPSEIPGFGPNAGKPPGFRPPASSGTGSTPESPIGSPPLGLPGLSREASGGAGIGDSDLPSFPGLDVDAGDRFGAGNLPALPGGL